ncbi:hypothetical protein [Tepidimonas ignava]|uniref:hypothetical protein n=1 Tax=Tepidimonas ignava TaxID=114249 RepID=UPI002FD8E48F
MTNNDWMRTWRVRTRMLGAIAVVLALLLALAGVGVWAVHHMQIAQHEALTLAWTAAGNGGDEAFAQQMIQLTEHGEQIRQQALWALGGRCWWRWPSWRRRPGSTCAASCARCSKRRRWRWPSHVAT